MTAETMNPEASEELWQTISALQEEHPEIIRSWHNLGYAEPDYNDPATKLIVLGDWNYDKGGCSCEAWPEDEPGVAEQIGAAVGKALGREVEKWGGDFSLNWSDEWHDCAVCGKLIRTMGDSYGWRAYHWYHPHEGYICGDCVMEDPEDYLEWLSEPTSEGPARALTFDGINLSEHGWKRLNKDFENGLYGGQRDNPQVIRASLAEKGLDRCIFVIDATGQFDLRFSTWIPQDAEIEDVKSAGSDPAEGMRRALQNHDFDSIPAPDGGVVVNKIDCASGTVATKVVSPEDFIAGKALD